MKPTRIIALAAALLLGVFAIQGLSGEKNHKPGTCVVSEEELGSMGKPVIVKHEGREIPLCCKSCIKKFEASPAKYIAMLR